MPYFGIPIRNGLPIGLGSVAGFGIAPFSPESLFENGEVGAWYDPSDYSTLFTDSAGTTPVTGVEQFVGLMLDKSQGLVLGPELVTNGDFSSGTTGWTGINATLAVVGGAVEITATVSGQARASQAVTTVFGRWYEARATIWQGTGAVNLDLLVSGIASSAAVSSTTPTAVVVRFLATSSSTTIRVGSAGSAVIGTTFFADNISVRELPGNHAFQTSSAKRPKLAARYNLLTYSEEFDVTTGGWAKFRGTITSTTESAPNSTNTACVLTQSAGQTTLPLLSQSLLSVPANFDLVFSGYVKQGTKPFAAIATDAPGSVGSNLYSYFEFATQTVTKNAGITSLVFTSVGNGWYRFELVTTTRASVGNVTVLIGSSNSTSINVTDDQGTIIIWGADLRPASQATGLIGPTYQRVAAATVYDTAGFLPYLAFDGLDDSMSTNSIDFSAGDKMTVWAGVRKLSDATTTNYQTVVELSASAGTNNGSFAQYSTGNVDGELGFYLRGTATSGFEPTTYNAPSTLVTATSYDIGQSTRATEIVPRINGVLNQTGAEGSADAGTGNFGNYPLFIGARNNTSTFFQGWLTSLIVRGAQSTQSQIEATEAWVNSRTGAY